MNIKFDMWLPPRELMETNCINCTHSKLQSYSDDKGNIFEIQTLCLIVHKLVTDTDAQQCDAFDSIHFESKRIKNYRKLE